MKRLLLLPALLALFQLRAQQIEAYRYWVNDDPSATTVSATGPSLQVNVLSELVLPGLTKDYNTVTIQFKDTSDVYSVPVSRIFTRNTGDVMGFEYWIDDDIANRISGTVTAGTIVNFASELPLCLTAGTHVFAIRFQGATGTWSVPVTRQFTATASPDTDGDGLCDALDPCPLLANVTPGESCNDNNACTVNDIVGSDCNCAGTFADTDNDGTCDANDLCPGGPEPGTACNDNDDCTTDDVIGSNCQCAGTFADADNDGTCDAIDLCPGGPEPGTTCDDGDDDTTNDIITGACICEGTPTGGGCTTNELELAVEGDGTSDVSWTIHVEGSTTVVDNGGQIYPPGTIGTSLCLPDGCYRLVVTDNAGDGITGGGYRLSLASGERIIDNTNNFTTGSTSAISGGQGFCLPLGIDRLITTNCDKLDWIASRYIVATENATVSSEWINGGANNVQDANSGYEFWIFDPNGSYSFRRFRSHNVSDGRSPANATRACHMKINSWLNTGLTPHIPEQILLNVRVRGRVNGMNQAFGPACLFKLDPARAMCPLVALEIEGATPSGPTCDRTRNWGGSNSPANKLTAQAPQPSTPVASSSVRYQFRFRHPEQCIVLPPQVSPTRHLNWNSTVAPALVPGRTYEADVRVSLNSGATWCIGSSSTSVATNCADLTPWGDICRVTIAGGVGSMMISAPNEIAEASCTMYPNPNRGDRFQLSLTGLGEEVSTATVDIFDMTGKRTSTRQLVVQAGMVNQPVEFGGAMAAGIYLVNITARSLTFSERLIIAP